MDSLKLAAVCLTSTGDKDRNIATALAYAQEAAKAGADWVQLPEMLAYHGPYDKVYEMAELEGGALYETMAKTAKELKIVLIAGTVGERPDRDNLPDAVLRNRNGHRKVFNTAYVFGRDGGLVAKYRKTHLFNLSDAAGGALYNESEGYLAGDKAVTCTIEGWKVGLSICYDLRFPRYYDLLEAQGAPEIQLIPSAFTKGTGVAHWELLLRSRAVERQTYVFAANQTGLHSPGKESFGHSMIIDPWGKVLADTGDQPGIAYATISRAALAEARGKLPALTNRRPELYGR